MKEAVKLEPVRVLERAESIGKQIIKRVRNNELSPFDFIQIIKSDPEMIDEFCYLNKRAHAYDFKIVEFNERNPYE